MIGNYIICTSALAIRNTGCSLPGLPSLINVMVEWTESSGPRKDPKDDQDGNNAKNNLPRPQDDKQAFPSSTSNSESTTTTATGASAFPKHTDWNSILNKTDWAQFKEPKNLIPTIALTAGILFAVHIHRRFLRRIPEANNISKSYFRRRSLLGQVTSVGDGDNFRMYHTPGGRLAGWGWLPWKKVPTSRTELKGRTVCVPPTFPLFCIYVKRCHYTNKLSLVSDSRATRRR
jgi:hypothetical protein